MLQAYFFELTYRRIAEFPLLAESLVNLEGVIANNLTEDSLISWLIQSLPSSPPQVVNEPLQVVGESAIQCRDTRGRLYNMTFQDYYETIQRLESQSSLAGGFVAYSFNIACTGWPIVSDDTFTGEFPRVLNCQGNTKLTIYTIGPFGGSTNNPILFVSNTLDPITPIFG
jgi:hypothetical protein